MITQTDEEALAEILERHIRTPVSWEQEPGVFVKCGPHALAKRLVMKLNEARVAPPTETELRAVYGDR